MLLVWRLQELHAAQHVSAPACRNLSARAQLLFQHDSGMLLTLRCFSQSFFFKQ
jgi:hypothetical protein